MVEVLRPTRGGFQRPFGTGWFIREYLAGHGPAGSERIDPDIGAPQTDIFSEYKDALRRALAEDLVAKEEERRKDRGESPLTTEEADLLFTWYMDRLPFRSIKMRYHSFLVYFGMLKRLGWVEESTVTEPSAIQEKYPEAPPRKYYRITDAGLAAPETLIKDPLMALYPDYDRSTRSAKRRKYLRTTTLSR